MVSLFNLMQRPPPYFAITVIGYLPQRDQKKYLSNYSIFGSKLVENPIISLFHLNRNTEVVTSIIAGSASRSHP